MCECVRHKKKEKKNKNVKGDERRKRRKHYASVRNGFERQILYSECERTLERTWIQRTRAQSEEGNKKISSIVLHRAHTCGHGIEYRYVKMNDKRITMKINCTRKQARTHAHTQASTTEYFFVFKFSRSFCSICSSLYAMFYDPSLTASWVSETIICCLSGWMVPNASFYFPFFFLSPGLLCCTFDFVSHT